MIEILELKKFNDGVRKASFNVKVVKWGNVLLRNCALFESNGKSWITLPQKEYTTNGEKKYFTLICYEDKDLNEKFKEAIKKAVYEKLSQAETQPTYEGIPF